MNQLAYRAELTRLQRLLAELQVQLRLAQDLKPLVKRQRDLVYQEMAQLGMAMRMNEGYRSATKQNYDYAQGRTRPGPIVTNAKGGDSFHQYGVAIDSVFVKGGYNVPESWWQTYGSVARKYGFEHGDRGYVDLPHIQMRLEYSLLDFKRGVVDYNKYK